MGTAPRRPPRPREARFLAMGLATCLVRCRTRFAARGSRRARMLAITLSVWSVLPVTTARAVAVAGVELTPERTNDSEAMRIVFLAGDDVGLPDAATSVAADLAAVGAVAVEAHLTDRDAGLEARLGAIAAVVEEQRARAALWIGSPRGDGQGLALYLFDPQSQRLLVRDVERGDESDAVTLMRVGAIVRSIAISLRDGSEPPMVTVQVVAGESSGPPVGLAGGYTGEALASQLPWQHGASLAVLVPVSTRWQLAAGARFHPGHLVRGELADVSMGRVALDADVMWVFTRWGPLSPWLGARVTPELMIRRVENAASGVEARHDRIRFNLAAGLGLGADVAVGRRWSLGASAWASVPVRRDVIGITGNPDEILFGAWPARVGAAARVTIWFPARRSETR